jgi:hypothetical protein
VAACGDHALALAYSFFEPDDNHSGKTLEQAVHEMLYRPQKRQEPSN